MHLYRHNGPFLLQSGDTLDGLTIAYHTFGSLAPDKSNVIWVCHALTANSDVSDWWPHTVEPGKFLDPDRHFIICANILGSHYGTTGPMSINPATGTPYYTSFPAIIMADMVHAHQLLASHLGIDSIKVLVGSSIGGFQATEWIAQEPDRFSKIILIATDAYASPWSIAINETQRMAIEADATYRECRPDGGLAGLATARALGLLTYRGPEGYNRTQQDNPSNPSSADPFSPHRACSYQRYQGKKLCDRFNAYSYMTILDAFDTHNIGRGRGGIKAVLAGVKAPVIVVGLSTDIVFTPAEVRNLASMFPNATYHEISSPFGHDGFLVEHEQLNNILTPFVNQ